MPLLSPCCFPAAWPCTPCSLPSHPLAVHPVSHFPMPLVTLFPTSPAPQGWGPQSPMSRHPQGHPLLPRPVVPPSCPHPRPHMGPRCRAPHPSPCQPPAVTLGDKAALSPRPLAPRRLAPRVPNRAVPGHPPAPRHWGPLGAAGAHACTHVCHRRGAVRGRRAVCGRCALRGCHPGSSVVRGSSRGCRLRVRGCLARLPAPGGTEDAHARARVSVRGAAGETEAQASRGPGARERGTRGLSPLSCPHWCPPPPPPPQVFVKCHFDYDPASDSLIPCKEAGLRFAAGDLLQIVNQDDPNWWQACHVEGGSAGLIPSQLLEEKRKAFVKRDLEVPPASGALCGSLSGRRKKRMMYLTTKNAEFDRHELLIYEEVARMPPFRRKTLVLIGAQGVGRRSLKNKLLMSDQARYGTTIPYTSRKPKESEKDGHGYRFVSRGEMEADIKAGRYLEHGEYEGNLYGTKIDSIRAVVDAGKMCILDVNPQAVKVLRTAEFVPYVVFIEAPGPDTLRAMNRAALESGVATKQLTEADARRTVEESGRIQRGYGHYFDLSLTNDDLERTFGRLRQAMERLRVEPQWVPVSWVY
uniref:MAGUK p55 scaffold protein 2 n=1 Tax=Anas platyrhynchos platyrhynchos TaxID=8840 RepID=A0A493TVY6_ANAPP